MDSLRLKITAHENGKHLVAADGGVATPFEFDSYALEESWEESRVPESEQGFYDQLRMCVGFRGGFRPSRNTLLHIGQWCFKKVFLSSPADQHRTHLEYAARKKAARERKVPLLLEVEISPATQPDEGAARRLQRLPWEMLVDTDGQDHWGLDPHLICVRVESQGKSAPSRVISAQQKLRVAHLGASISKAGEGRLDLATEREELETAVRRMPPWFDLLPFREADESALRNSLKQQADLDFLSCHGRRGEVLITSTGQTRAEYINNLVAYFRDIIHRSSNSPSWPLLVGFHGCGLIELAHDVAREGGNAFSNTGDVQDEIALYVYGLLLQELVWTKRFDVAIHRLRQNLDLGESLPPPLHGDRDRLRWQALLIAGVLPSNRSEATLDRGPLARFDLTNTDPSGTSRNIEIEPLLASSPARKETVHLPAGRKTTLLLPPRPYRFRLVGGSSASGNRTDLVLHPGEGFQLSLFCDRQAFPSDYETTKLPGYLRIQLEGGRSFRRGLIARPVDGGDAIPLENDSTEIRAWLPPGSYQVYDPEGRLVPLLDRGGNTLETIEIEWAKDHTLSAGGKGRGPGKWRRIPLWFPSLLALVLYGLSGYANYWLRTRDTVLIPGGKITAGNPDNHPLLDILRLPEAKDYDRSELLNTPVQEVQMKSFLLDKREVSVAAYGRFLAAVKREGHKWCHPDEPPNKDHTPAETGRPDEPVRGVDFFDAYAYARSQGKRLPTAEEFEYASRGPGSPRLYGLQDKENDSRVTPANCRTQESPQKGVAPVAAYAQFATPEGVQNLVGNVREIVLLPEVEIEPGVKLTRIGVRGGSCADECVFMGLPWVDQIEINMLSPRASKALVEAAQKKSGTPQDVIKGMRRISGTTPIGFRCAKDLPPNGPGAKDMAEMAQLPSGSFTSGPGGGQKKTPMSLEQMSRWGLSDTKIEGLLQPQREVYVPAFRISRFLVSLEEYQTFLKARQSESRPGFIHPFEPNLKTHAPPLKWLQTQKELEGGQLDNPKQPVVGIPWWDAEAYARWRGMELPTADQWEYAVRRDERGGTQRYPTDNSPDLNRIVCVEHPLEEGKSQPSLVNDERFIQKDGIIHLIGNCAIWTRSGSEPGNVHPGMKRYIVSGGFNEAGSVWGQGFTRRELPVDYRPDEYSGSVFMVGIRLTTPAGPIRSDFFSWWQWVLLAMAFGLFCNQRWNLGGQALDALLARRR